MLLIGQKYKKTNSNFIMLKVLKICKLSQYAEYQNISHLFVSSS